MKTTTNLSKYEKQATDFLQKTGAKMTIKFSHSGKHFDDDKQVRDIYNIELSRGSRKYCFKFGQSISKSGLRLNCGRQLKYIDLPKDKSSLCELKNQSELRRWIKTNLYFDLMPSDAIIYPEAPTSYDILACLQKYDIGTFEDFCGEFGYNIDSRRAEKIYNAVCLEYENLCKIFTEDEMLLMQEIS